MQVSENDFVLSPVFGGGLTKYLKGQLAWFIFYYSTILPLNAILLLHVTLLLCNRTELNQWEPLSWVSERSLVAHGWGMTCVRWRVHIWAWGPRLGSGKSLSCSFHEAGGLGSPPSSGSLLGPFQQQLQTETWNIRVSTDKLAAKNWWGFSRTWKSNLVCN